MNHRRLTDLTAVLAGTAVFFTILAAAGTKKAAQAVSGTVRTAAVVCTGAFCYDAPQTLPAASHCWRSPTTRMMRITPLPRGIYLPLTNSPFSPTSCL